MAKIYEKLNIDDALSFGYFKPDADFKPLSNTFKDNLDVDVRSSGIVYFPGSFGSFHKGHRDIADRAMRDYPGYILVIAPSNSSYTSHKYGVWSIRASNKARYDQIKNEMEGAPYQWVINIEPMLNFECDHNFTDLFYHFIEKHEVGYDKKHVILFGKDRENFKGIQDHTNDFEVAYYNDTTGHSTSKTPSLNRNKKYCMLRCSNEQEVRIFENFFHDQYEEIIPFYLEDERILAKALVRFFNIKYTNCKEYSDFLIYMKMSRTFKNPLEDGHIEEVPFPEGSSVLDSDVYTGTTEDAINNSGSYLFSVLNLKFLNEKCEIVDFDDFKKEDFCYPYFDISERCSMQAFDQEFHERFNQFKREIK